MAVREAEEESDIDKLISRRNDISLQDAAATTTAARDVEEGGDMIIRAVLPRLIDTAVFTFNLAFLTATEAAAAP
ncbi:hypothetical protein BDBG_16954 [Blastomyces gilchristii SLH14081]|uniref:Uncharacterized protein n=1 Tax=Blastomyces gilchristii (strain SLH14081) TaxID=559298 RepID=A0A179UJ13_BLAGS|nr:uncharacterized protein BDBG_16954 [Blastomyces gilchristii SLH14081]OAT08056.1 hypothetical protein BDBG_16954 [Blastomyces gilchristii SLH14081]